MKTEHGEDKRNNHRSNKESKSKTVCKDFLRNVCHLRTRRCKYKHPSPQELDQIVDVSDSKTVYEFCHDYQNTKGGCPRTSCRFIHCSKDEEETYHKTKRLALRLKYQYDFGIGDCYVVQHEKGNLEKTARTNHDSISGPVCRDFTTKRECLRGNTCKFFHPDRPLSVKNNPNIDLSEQQQSMKRARLHFDNSSVDMDCGVGGNEHNMMKYPPPPAMNEFEPPQMQQQQQHIDPQMQQHNPNNIPFQNMKNIEEENHNLKRRVNELEKQVSDLSATNEVLLEQNAQFRLQKRGITNYKMATATSFTPNVTLNPVANVVSNNTVPLQLSVQVASQPEHPDFMNGQAGAANGPQHQVVGAGQTTTIQVPVSVQQSTAMAAQVIAVNANSNVEQIPGTNHIVSYAQVLPAQANLTQMGQQQQHQPIVSFQQQHIQAPPQQQQQPPQQIVQPVSYARTVVAAALAGGRWSTQPQTASASMNQPVHQTNVGSMGPPVAMPPRATMMYTGTRSTENVLIVNKPISATGHEMAIVAAEPPPPQQNTSSMAPPAMHVPPPPQQNPSSMGAPLQLGPQQNSSSMGATIHVCRPPAYNNNPTIMSSQPSYVPTSSHQNSAMPHGSPMTSCILATHTSMQPTVSMGHPANMSTSSQRNVPPGNPQMNDQQGIMGPYPIQQPPPMHS